ncbi:MAG: hypothetical protein PHY83_06375 [Bacilli bacterium]|nr:hypothetical protein [Bacilli bacterium]MDD3127228.1 hypothetical protein [Candidatus Izemoplasmatales bacterium]
MGGGSKFDSALSTRGGRSNFITGENIASGDPLAKDILGEMAEKGIKFTENKIVFAARLDNGNHIFLENDRVSHIMERHGKEFKDNFGVKNHQELSSLLSDTISKGKLISSFRKDSHGLEGYRSIYYYKGKYTIVYSIASNGYIETAFTDNYYGG